MWTKEDQLREGQQRCANGTRLVGKIFRKRWLELWMEEEGHDDETAKKVSLKVLNELDEREIPYFSD